MDGKQSGNIEIWGGVECTINRVGNNYYSQLDYAGYYQLEDNVDRISKLGLKKLRYPVLWEKHQDSAAKAADFSEIRKELEEFHLKGIDIIAGLLHHGCGPAYVDFMNDSFADGLALYAQQVAGTFPWIEYYTPVNEPVTTARFSGLYGHWYPHGASDSIFCRILVNECRATVMAMEAIRVINPAAKLVQTEDLGKVHSTPLLNYQADFENERRWLSCDLLCGRIEPGHAMWSYLVSSGIKPEELNYFLQNPCPPAIMGFNYYLTSERYLDENMAEYPEHSHGGNAICRYADVEAVRVGKIKPDGAYTLLMSAWERYHLPLALTEVHLGCNVEEQMRWIKHLWQVANRLKHQGAGLLAITIWALYGSYGWDKLLTCERGTYEPGVFDLSDGEPRATLLSVMVAAYADGMDYNHPALHEGGWWESDCRVIYGKEYSL